MRTALDASPADLDEEEREFVEAIREHGWCRTEVLADGPEPAFHYTTGFWLTAGFPEIILFSLGGETAHEILWDLYRDAKAGALPAIGAPAPGIIGNGEAALIPVDPAQHADYLGWNQWFYGTDGFPCLQLVWPDRQGGFPWQSDFDPSFAALQPDLSRKGWTRTLSGK